MSPLQIKILLHYYVSPEPYDGVEPLSFQEELIVWGMLNKISGEYYLSDRGKFYVEHLLEIPPPIQKWEIPELILPRPNDKGEQE